MICGACGAENPAANRFCGECGIALSRVCPSCGTPIVGTPRFCGSCGKSLEDAVQSPAAGEAPTQHAVTPASERRVVSVLFADLVGFTTLSEARDSEEVRELLSKYFETCRTLIARYGGTVEKFIGDAVMAVWGTPVAKEDDAERAVRAALELTGAVAAIGEEVGAPELRVRAGVLTGEAAVTIGASSEGMVAGDLVNTASRIQSVAEPGSVFVGDATWRASQLSIAYEDAGTHELKGKTEPVQLWRAVRVLAGVGGAQRSIGLESPFVGRDRELRVIKELFHASAEDSKPHLISVVGLAGVGKSRLSWEFFKYIDGLADGVRWHRGRCLAYGEGVSYWALAEMVRTRADIVEGEDAATASAKLHAAVEETIVDPQERRWVEPRLANLLGLDDHADGDQESLFAAWRLFYERLADEIPTIMVFEDMQWADEGLLDFVDYLLEWSAGHPLFIVTMARPEILDRRPSWGSVRKSATSVYLEPLVESAMERLLTSLVPDLSADLRQRILERAEGVPLYAVETIRMLLDRGALAQDGSVYRVIDTVDTLEVPETLHALIAARLDGLSPAERRLVQDAAVLGKTFTKGAIVSLTGLNAEDLDPLLTSLVRKEVLSVLADPFSPERGQYGFLQDLVKRVAYETLAKKERKARHLSAAAYIESVRGADDDDLVEVAASHCLEAYRLAPDAEDAPEIRDRAREMLVRAGERARTVAAHAEAQRYFDDAAALTDDLGRRAELAERAGIAARVGADNEIAKARFDQAIKGFEQAGDPLAAARVSAKRAEILWDSGRFADAVESMDRSYVMLASHGVNEDLAQLAAQLGRFQYFSGHTEIGLERVEAAIDAAESLMLPEVLSSALNTKAVILYSAKGRRREGFALLKYALEVALEHDIAPAALRAYYNLSDIAAQSDRYVDGRDFVDQGLALARRVGNRFWEWSLLGQLYSLYALGDWDDLIERAESLPTERLKDLRAVFAGFMVSIPKVRLARGDLEGATLAAASFSEDVSKSDDVQEQSMWFCGQAAIANARGDHTAALRAAESALSVPDIGLASEGSKESIIEALEAAWQLHDDAALDRLLGMIDAIPRGKLPQYLEAHAMRFRSRISEREGDLAGAEERLKGAAGLFHELHVPFWTAVSQLELAERLAAWGRGEDSSEPLSRALDVFESLKADPWMERARSASGMAANA